MAYSEAQKRATEKYSAKTYDQIHVRAKKGRKEKYQALAESKGKSLNQFIIEYLEKELGEQ